MSDSEFLVTDAGGPGIIPPLDAVPLPESPKKPSLTDRELIFSAAQTAEVLQELGERIEIDEIAEGRAQEMFQTGRTPTAYEQRHMPAEMIKLNALLTTYDYQLLDDHHRIRSFVKNRLLEEADDPDPRIRLKAYEMLGKITEVALFTERSEVITRKDPEALTSKLREKLANLIENPPQAAFPDASQGHSAKERVKALTVESLIDDMELG